MCVDYGHFIIWVVSDMKEESVSPEELERYRSSKKEMDRFLGPYPYER